MAPPSSGWVVVPMWALACMYSPRVTRFMFEHGMCMFEHVMYMYEHAHDMFEHAMCMFEHAIRMGRQAAVADFRSPQVW